MSQLELFTPLSRAPAKRHEPYATYDARAAKRIILERLQKSGGNWVRRMALRRATGMRPELVAAVFEELTRAGLIEFNEAMQIIHSAHGPMGHTRGYRICNQMQEAA